MLVLYSLSCVIFVAAQLLERRKVAGYVGIVGEGCWWRLVCKLHIHRHSFDYSENVRIFAAARNLPTRDVERQPVSYRDFDIPN